MFIIYYNPTGLANEDKTYNRTIAFFSHIGLMITCYFIKIVRINYHISIKIHSQP